MLDYLSDIIIILVLVGIVVFVVINRRNRMFKLWQDVSRHEVAFHRNLFDTARAFAHHAETLDIFQDLEIMQEFTDGDKDERKSLGLEERQALFKALQTLYVSLDEENVKPHAELREKFEALQTLRLRYNSKVLYYNRFIMMFPMRLFARRMGFEEKEYFG